MPTLVAPLRKVPIIKLTAKILTSLVAIKNQGVKAQRTYIKKGNYTYIARDQLSNL